MKIIIANEQPGIPLSIVQAGRSGTHIYKKLEDGTTVTTSGHKQISIALQKQSDPDAKQAIAATRGTRITVNAGSSKANARPKNSSKSRVKRITPEDTTIIKQESNGTAKSTKSPAPGSVKRIYQQQQIQQNGQTVFFQQGVPAGPFISRKGTEESPDDNNENADKQTLIKRLLSADKVDVGSGKQTAGQSGPIQEVSIAELEKLGLSVKRTDSERVVNSPSSIKSEESTKSSNSNQSLTPTTNVPTMPIEEQQMTFKTEMPDTGRPTDVSQGNSIPNSPFVSMNHKLDEKKGLIDIKQESKPEKSKIEKVNNRKRKQSADTKTTKKRKTKADEGNGNSLIPLSLAEAPIRLNIDSLTPLGGGTVAKLGKDWDGVGKKYWYDTWNFGGWMQNAVHFYDVFRY